MSILSKVKAAAKKVTSTVKKAASTVKGNVQALTGTSSIKSYTSNTAGGQKVAALNKAYNPSINYSSTGGQKVAAANLNPATNYAALSKKTTPTAVYKGGGSSVSGGQVGDSYSTSDTRNASVSSYTPSLREYGSAVTTGELSGSSAITTGTRGQTNAGVNNFNTYAGYGEKANTYINDYEKGLAERRAAAEKERDSTLEYIQKQLGDAAEDTRIDRAEIEKQAGLREAEREASQIKSEILGIKAEFEAKRQSLIGQGRGIPEVIIGGQQEALDRQEAIKSMPLLARYQIATDNIAAAKETVANFIADEQAYLNRVYQQKVSVLNKAYDLAVGKEKDAVSDFKDAYTMQIKSQSDANDLKLKLINSYLDNKQTPPNSLLSYDTSNPNSKNDLISYASGIRPSSDSMNTNSFGDIMQEAINAGASPEQAAREAAAVSESMGISVDQKTLNSWVAAARNLQKITPVTESPELNVESSAIDDRAKQLATGGRTTGAIRDALVREGYSSSEAMAAANKANEEDFLNSTINSISNALFGK